MSKLSIYENSWLNLVFEGKNKEYGAYQLRKKSDETTLLAFCLGLFFTAMIASIPAILNHFTAVDKTPVGIPQAIDRIIEITNINPNKPKKPLQMAVPANKKIKDDVKKEKLKNVVVSKSEEANKNIVSNNQSSTTTNTINEGILTDGKNNTGNLNIPVKIENNENEFSESDLKSTIALDKLPEFPGGIKKFYAFVGNNFEKPESDEVKTIKVYVTFVIEKDGSITDIQVRRDPGYGLAKEAIRVLKSLKTKWEPGMIAGKPVRTAYSLPIVVEMK